MPGGPDVLVAGETLIDFLPEEEGSLSEVSGFTRRAGGAPANVAVALSRLGQPPLFWTRVGDDPFGDFLVGTLREEGVPDEFVERDPAAKTTLAFVAHEGADSSFTFYRDGTADTRLEPDRVPDERLGSVEWAVVGGVALSAEPSRSAVLDLLERARDHGCTVAFDPNARPELWEGRDFGAAIREVLEGVDVLKATPGDLRTAGFEGDERAIAETILDRGPHTVLLTLGEAGAMVESSDEAPWGATSTRHPGYEVDATDATGAGDAFLAGAVASLSAGEGIEGALGFASAVAAISTTTEGAMTALPDRETVEAFRSSRE